MSEQYTTTGISDLLRGQIKFAESGDGIVAPKNVIPTVTAGRGLYNKYRLDSLRRIELYAEIEGLLSGNPPYDPVEIEQSKLGFISNFNDLKARSLYER